MNPRAEGGTHKLTGAETPHSERIVVPKGKALIINDEVVLGFDGLSTYSASGMKLFIAVGKNVRIDKRRLAEKPDRRPFVYRPEDEGKFKLVVMDTAEARYGVYIGDEYIVTHLFSNARLVHPLRVDSVPMIRSRIVDGKQDYKALLERLAADKGIR